MNKRGMAFGIIAILLALVLLAVFLGQLASRECNTNSDCAADAYCGSDNQCHAYPDEIIVTKNNFLPAALVVGVGVIIAAYIVRRR